MSDDPIILLIALLIILCQVLIVALLAIIALAPSSPAVRNIYRTIKRNVAPLALPLAFVVALATISGSLYFSEVKHYIPCHLCWIQRSLLYPQFILIGLLLWKPSLKWIKRLSAGLLIACLPVSTYHYLLEWYPSLEGSSFCDPNNPCTLVWLREFEYVSIPLMALTAALTMLLLLFMSRSTERAN